MTISKKIQSKYLLAILIATATAVAGPLFSCSYDYDENYDYTKENLVYLEAAKNQALQALINDARVRSILDGTDTAAKDALQALIDKLEGLQDDVDGVAYSIIIEAMLANGSVTNTNVAAAVASVVSVIEAMAAHDNKSAIAETIRDGAAADNARAAFNAYAENRTSDTIQVMIDSYYKALEQNFDALAKSAPIATSIIYAASLKATEGADSIDKIKEALTAAGKTVSGDAATTTQKSGLGLIALLLEQMTIVHDAAKTAGRDDVFNNQITAGVSKVVNAVSSGLPQLALVVTTRIVKAMVEDGRSQEEIAAAIDSLVALFERLGQASDLARNAASGAESTVQKSMAGLLAELIQLISGLNTEEKAKATAESLLTLIDDIAGAAGDATKISDILTTYVKKLSKELGGSDTPDDPAGDTKTYSVGGTVTGLSGSLVLKINEGSALTVSTAGAFTFATKLLDGSAYAVTIATQPATQICSVASGNGTISGGNVTNVTVQCSTNYYSISGSISGVTGTVVLRNNGADDLTLTDNGSFSFATEIADGSTYAITVVTHPANKTCSVANGSGTVSGGPVTNVTVTCAANTYSIGGTISSLSGTIVLQNNAGDNKTVTTNGSFSFDTAITHGGAYAVTVLTHPTGQLCAVTNGSGTATSAVSNVSIICENVKYIAARFGAMKPNLGADAASAVAAADALCVASYATGYKALLGSSVRSPGTDWPLAANQKYVRYGSTIVVGTTDSSGKFSFPLNAEFGAFSGVTWTGLNADWTIAAHTCSNWTSESSGINGIAGTSGSTTSTALTTGTRSCNQFGLIYCVGP